jgi:hypothetical protein
LTAPAEVPVVLAAKVPEAPIPKRTSLPSMLPPAWAPVPLAAAWSTPARATIGLPACSAATAVAVMPAQMTAMAANTAQPWRLEPTSRP